MKKRSNVHYLCATRHLAIINAPRTLQRCLLEKNREEGKIFFFFFTKEKTYQVFSKCSFLHIFIVSTFEQLVKTENLTISAEICIFEMAYFPHVVKQRERFRTQNPYLWMFERNGYSLALERLYAHTYFMMQCKVKERNNFFLYI